MTTCASEQFGVSNHYHLDLRQLVYFLPVTGLPCGGPFLLVNYAPTLKRTP
jgi:hypothetical protein